MRRAAYKTTPAHETHRPGGKVGESFGPELSAADLARRLAELAHPIRVSILQRLIGAPACVSDFVEALGEDQPKVSQHLKVLRDGGLIECRVDGRRRCYRVRQPEVVGRLLEALGALHQGPLATGEDDCGDEPIPN